MWLAMKLEHTQKSQKIIILIKKYTSNVLEPSLEIVITFWFLVH